MALGAVPARYRIICPWCGHRVAVLVYSDMALREELAKVCPACLLEGRDAIDLKDGARE